MIISASYKTDIPAFYGQWFMTRLRAGYCKMVNPYNRRASVVSLKRDDVQGIVFWTKNLGPFVRYLPEVADRGYPFVIQHTVTGYPRALEHSVVDASVAVRHILSVAERFGPNVCVWRYDPIVFSSLTTEDFHERRFTELVKAMRGAVNEVVVSFLQLYTKTARNMTKAGTESSFTWHDPAADAKLRLLGRLASIAADADMRVTVCSQKEFLIDGVVEARCVDANRLAAISGKYFSVDLRGNRKECGCFASRDIGDYDTCPHGCVYCYAVRDQDMARRRFRQHDPAAEFLFTEGVTAETDRQISLL